MPELPRCTPPLPADLARYDPTHEWVDSVTNLKRQERYDEALTILEGCMAAEEAHIGGVAPWYYEQAAIIHRKKKDRAAELGVLRRYAAQPHAPGALPPKLLARLAKLESAET
ncbi:MAG: hypothetical protein OXH86_01390 [Acidimicrobiaceae bacterium]|nr:hypothetical protein [Acidimicrobiaceae bacterium]